MNRMRQATRCAGVLLTAGLCAWPASRAFAQEASDRRPPQLEPGVDPGVLPGDDFFAFANGDWLRTTEIPAGRESWNARTEINELTRRQVTALLDDAAAEPPGSIARKVADFRAAWLNERAIEDRGIAPLAPLLDSIDKVRDKAALTRLLGSSLGADVDPLNWGVFRSARLLGLSVEPGIRGEASNVAFLLQGGLGLPDREHYVSTEPRMQALRIRYHEYIRRMLALARFPREEERARAVMALETAMARGQATREASADDANAGNRWTPADFARRAPGMDWSAFLGAAGLAKEEAIVGWQPGALTTLAALVGSESLETWKDYLRFHLIHGHAEVLPRAFADEAAALRAVVDGRAPAPRAQRALEATESGLSEELGRMYVERHLPADRKARVQAIVADVADALAERVRAAPWMSPRTKAQALAKLETLYVGIGYPDRWQDDDGLVVDPVDALGNLRRVADRNYRRALGRLGRPVDRAEWWIAPQRAGAILLFNLNAYDFSAALLQPPKFDSAASDAASYGAIGAIIGHDISHFVDLLGAEYDTTGRKRGWWTAEDSARFAARAEPLVQQFSAYRPFPDLGVDGKATRSENIADLAGLAAAFDAHRKRLGDRAADRNYVRRQDREFFIGFARSWRGKMTEAGLRAYLANDIHAPERYRIATVRNLDAWYDAFDVKPGQQLYLAPEARVTVW